MKKEPVGTYLVFGLLLLLAAVLRLFNPFHIPFTYDEMSAILRTHYTNIADLVRKGVMLGDTHPAGVQVFLYYWTKLLGYSEIIVKLSFIACGILSVYYVFRIGKEWFNSTTGLVSAAYLATIQYTIFYSQIARPYSSGLFFSLVMVWHWYKVVFKPAENYYKNLFLYVLFSAFCAYNHHFSLLFAAIVGFTGVFFVRGKYLRNYALAGIGIFILYIPHLPVFLYQLKQGGVGGSDGWLVKPDNTFIFEYIEYILQFSTFSYILAGLLLLWGIISRIRKKEISTPYYIISLCWFLIPFLTGFFYSKYVNPVIQYSVLIFSFPFMLYGVFGLLPRLNTKALTSIVLLICVINIFMLVNGRKYYSVFYRFHYERQIVINDSILKNKGQDKFIALLKSPNDDSVFGFYINKYHSPVSYTRVFDSSSKFKLIHYLETSKKPYLTYDNAASSNPLYLAIILNYYPYVMLANNELEATNYIFTSIPSEGKSPYIFQSLNDFEKPCTYWSEAGKSSLCDTVSFSGKYSYRLDSKNEWAPNFSCDLDKMVTNKHNYIIVSLWLYPLEPLKDVQIVSSLKSGDTEIYWGSTEVNQFMPGDTCRRWMKAYHIFQLPENCFNYPDIKASIYIWNKGRKNFYMDNFEVRTMEGNPIVYGLVGNMNQPHK